MSYDNYESQINQRQYCDSWYLNPIANQANKNHSIAILYFHC